MRQTDSRAVRTLYNAILRIARNFLETRENIKILTHPFYHINLGWFSWEWSKKKYFFFRKKNSKWPTQKKLIFQNRQFSKKYRKCIFWLFLSFCRTASRPYTLSYINALVSRKFLAMRNIALYSVTDINFYICNQTSKLPNYIHPKHKNTTKVFV